MFSNLIVYRIEGAGDFDLPQAELRIQAKPFAPCAPSQESSSGFVPPRGDEHGALIESVAGQWILRFKTESKNLPGSVVAKRVQEKCRVIERETGRKPGSREKRELKDEARTDLMPMAFSKEICTWIWIDQANKLIFIDTGTQSRADLIVTALVEAFQSLSVSLVHTQTSPQASMAHWLGSQEPPVGFTIDRECELKSADESKAVVRYGRHPLDIEEIQTHISQGKLPTKLALTWDDRVSFMLTEGLQLKKVQFLDTVFEGTKSDEGGFDTDVAIATGELTKLIPDLIAALGGESESGMGQEARPMDLKAQGNAIAPGAGSASSWWSDGPDPMYEEAVKTVRSNNRASISLLQRVFRIGYNRAAGLLADMEKAGVVGAMQANGSREVIA